MPEDNNNKPPSDQPLQSYDNPRESHANPMEVHSIPFQDEDLELLKTRPIPSDFNIQQYKEHLEDPAVATVHRKKARLSTIHEQLVHISFHRLKIIDIS